MSSSPAVGLMTLTNRDTRIVRLNSYWAAARNAAIEPL